MLKQRIATAIVLATLFLAALFGLVPGHFSILMALVVGYAGWEWSALAGFSGLRSRLVYTLGLLILVGLAGWQFDFSDGAAVNNRVRSLLAWACAWWAIALLWVQGYPSSALLWGKRWLCAAMGIVVLVPTWVALTTLIHLANGAWLVFSVVVLVALADIGAFFSGRAFGLHKLAPEVSPGKTWEGFAGGILAIVIVAMFYALSGAGEQTRLWAWLLLAVITGLASVVGDLLVSMVKRHRGVKDSGTILPGHGGVLDRVDGLTAALPVFALMYGLLYEHQT